MSRVQGLARSGSERRLEDPAVRWMLASSAEALVLQTGDDADHRLRCHERAPRELGVREARRALDRRQGRILGRREPERIERVIHLVAQADLHSLDKIADSTIEGIVS